MARSPCQIWMNGSLGLADSGGRAGPDQAGPCRAGLGLLPRVPAVAPSLPTHRGREGGAASSHEPQ